jgi:hypothetical protein
MSLSKPVIVVAVLALFATPAFAFHCPADMKKIDAAMASANLPEAAMARVKQLRMEGEELHKAGKHQESLDKLGEAMKMLGIS